MTMNSRGLASGFCVWEERVTSITASMTAGVVTDARKADVVLDNPPWVLFRYMSAEFQKRFREECLWVGGKVATQQDLASYFYMRCSGRIALVLPYAALSCQAYAAFRKGEVAQAGHVAFRLRFTGTWIFDPEVQPLFPVPNCVLFAEAVSTPPPASLPATVTAFASALPHRNTAPAKAALAEKEAPWPADAAASEASHYCRAFRQGASLVPRRLVPVEYVLALGMLPANPLFPLVTGTRGKQDKAPWKDVTPPQGALEMSFLRPACWASPSRRRAVGSRTRRSHPRRRACAATHAWRRDCLRRRSNRLRSAGPCAYTPDK